MGLRRMVQSGLNFLVVFRRKSGKALSKYDRGELEKMLGYTFISYTRLSGDAYIASGLNEDAFQPKTDDLLVEASEFASKAMSVMIAKMGIPESGMAVAMIAPLSLVAGGPVAVNLFDDIGDVFQSSTIEESDDGSHRQPKTKADKWFDGLLSELNGDE